MLLNHKKYAGQLSVKAADSQVPKSGEISSEDLDIINSMTRGGKSYSLDDITTITAVVSNNMVSRSYRAWSKESAISMPNYLVSAQAMTDHDWGHVSAIWGRTFESMAVQVGLEEVTPEERTLSFGRRENKIFNEDIARRDGLIRVYARAYIEKSHPLLAAVESGGISEISIGAFEYQDIHCPLCNTPFSWYGADGKRKRCGHYPPHPWWGRDLNDPDEAPYYIMQGLNDMGEFSIVTVPDVPGTAII